MINQYNWPGIVFLFSVLVGLLGGLIFGIFCLIRLLLKLKRLNQPKNITYYILMILCILTALASWVFNFGWYRVILSWIAFPIIHAGAFAVVNGMALPKLIDSSKLRSLTTFSFLTYVLSYLFFPDGGDIGSMYVFFGLFHDDTVATVFGVFSVIAFVAYIILTINQIIELCRMKTRR